jgi:hypothetical protein
MTGIIQFKSIYGVGRTDFKLYGSLYGYHKDGTTLKFGANRMAKGGGVVKAMFEICSGK